MTITPISGYDPSFSWQVGFNSPSAKDNLQQFRATVRPLHGMELFTRIPNNIILYEETGIIINSTTNQGQWSFPLDINANISGGPYRDYQVVIEAYDSNGNTSAGNTVGSIPDNENGWIAYSQGYDIIAINNPRQTGIELGNNLPTYIALTGGNSGIISNNTGKYTSLNYMGTHGEINIRYLQGSFNSNLVGGFIYVWTGQFPKMEASLGIHGYSDVSRVQFNFNPLDGFIYHPTAATKYRGANQVYISVSFYDNLDAAAIENGLNIRTGLYISDNAIAYNDIAAGSISIGGFQTIYSAQYTGNVEPTGILGTGTSIIATQKNNGITSVLYLANPIVTTGISKNYTGFMSTLGGGAGGNAILFNNVSISNPVLLSFICNSSNSWSCPSTPALTFSCTDCCSNLNLLNIGDSMLANPNGLSICFNVQNNGTYTSNGKTYNIVQDDPSNWQGSAGRDCGVPFIITRMT